VNFTVYTPTFTDSSGGGKTMSSGAPGEISVSNGKVVLRVGLNGGDTNNDREIWISDDGGAVFDYAGLLTSPASQGGIYTTQLLSGANIIYKGECYEYALYHHHSAAYMWLMLSRGPDGVPTGSFAASTQNWVDVGHVMNETEAGHRLSVCSAKGAVDYQGGMVPYMMIWNDAGGPGDLRPEYFLSQDGMLWYDEATGTAATQTGNPSPGTPIPGYEVTPVILGTTSARHRVIAWLYDLDRFDHAGSDDGPASQYRLYSTQDDNNGAGGIYDRSTGLLIMENLRQDVGSFSGEITLVTGTSAMAARAMAVTVSCEQSSVVVFERNVLSGSKRPTADPKYYSCYGIPTGTYDINVTTSEGTVASYAGQTIASEVVGGAVSLYAGDICGATTTAAKNGVVNLIDSNCLKANLGKSGSV
jgi:hypothetical protein